MMIHEITVQVGKYPKRKRIGRGEGSGTDGTAGRGHKGAKSRAGWTYRPWFEGGQISFARRLPKRGFSNVQFETRYAIVNLKALDAACEDGDEVTAEVLAKRGLIRNAKLPLKVLGEGDLTKKITVTADRFSGAARSKIEAAGGTANETGRFRPRKTEGGNGKDSSEAAIPAEGENEKKSSGKKKKGAKKGE